MGNVLRIFFSDLRNIGAHFFSLVIALSVLLIPALYAWVNIYANSDPYGSTGNIKIALASYDKGFTDEDGEYINAGQEIIADICKSNAIDWTPVDDPDDAINRVRSGEFYAALIMEENLSRNMYNITEALRDKNPSISFYQNAKINAIANKITTTAATTAEHNIQVRYLSVLIETLFENVDEALEAVDPEERMDALIDMLTGLRDNMQKYSLAVGSLRELDTSLVSAIDQALEHEYGVSQGAIDNIANTEAAINNIKGSLLARLDRFDSQLGSLEDRLSGMGGDAVTEEALAGLLSTVSSTKSDLQSIRDALPAGSAAANSADRMIDQLTQMEEQIKAAQDNGVSSVPITDILGNWQEHIDNLRSLNQNQLRPAVQIMFDGMAKDTRTLYTLLNSIDATTTNIPPMLESSKASLLSLGDSINYLQNILSGASVTAGKLLDKVLELRESGKLDELVLLLDGDPEEFADFLSQPVQVLTEAVYPVENYGSAVAPFYSTLAIWVGGVVLAAIFKTEAEPEDYLPRRMKQRQLFWGRFFTFFFLSLLQSAIIVWGDLHLLHCQCLEPALFYLCAALTAFVFTSLIFSLVLAFGDVGKAIIVVIMITQISGSSGTYPIEILPPIFSSIYLFFPFPYAINAMREAMFGMYGLDIYLYLLELMVFAVLGLLIGLFVRRSFVRVKLFVEEEIERTGIL